MIDIRKPSPKLIKKLPVGYDERTKLLITEDKIYCLHPDFPPRLIKEPVN